MSVSGRVVQVDVICKLEVLQTIQISKYDEGIMVDDLDLQIAL